MSADAKPTHWPKILVLVMYGTKEVIILSQVHAICVQIAYHSNLEVSSLSGDFKKYPPRPAFANRKVPCDSKGFTHTHTHVTYCIFMLIFILLLYTICNVPLNPVFAALRRAPSAFSPYCGLFINPCGQPSSIQLYNRREIGVECVVAVLNQVLHKKVHSAPGTRLNKHSLLMISLMESTSIIATSNRTTKGSCKG